MFGKRKHERASGSAHERERTERKIAEEAARSCKREGEERREKTRAYAKES